MSDPISFDPFLGWVDTTDPDNLPVDVRIIGAADLLRYENFGVAATTKINAESTRLDGEIVRIDTANTNIAALDTRIDGVDTALVGVDTRFDAVEAGLVAEAGKVGFVRKLSDSVRTATTTLADDNNLTVTLGSYELIEITAVLFVTSPAAADIKFAFTGSGVAAGRWGTNGGAAVGWTPNGSAIALSTTGTQQLFVLQGLIGAGELGGVCALQWAQYVSDAGNTTLHSFSYLTTRTVSGV